MSGRFQKGVLVLYYRFNGCLDLDVNCNRLCGLAKQKPLRTAEALVTLDIPEIIDQHLNWRWEVDDIFIERYKMSRGRVLAGQKRGRSLENEVEAILKANGIAFQRGVTFIGRKSEAAKCSFAIPTKDRPKMVIETVVFTSFLQR
jgi:hypothetical protein